MHQQGVQQSFLEHCPLTEPLRQAMWLFLRLGFVKKADFSKRHQLSQKCSGQRVWGMLLGSIMDFKNVINFTLPYLEAAGFLNLA